VVKFAVNRAGQVVSARLWAGSGLAEADASAVAAVDVMRFSPAAPGSAELQWDAATFYWKTIEPPPGATGPANTAPAAPPGGPPP
jgi:TonB family protein